MRPAQNEAVPFYVNSKCYPSKAWAHGLDLVKFRCNLVNSLNIFIKLKESIHEIVGVKDTANSSDNVTAEN